MANLTLNTISVPTRMHRFSYRVPKPSLHSLCLRRLRRSPVTIHTAAVGPTTASSSGFSESVGDALPLGQVSIYSVATGEPVLIKELWDQDEGGMLVFKGKELVYARKDEGTGDHAPLDDILNIYCKVPAA